MKTVFNYNKFAENKYNTLVDSFVSLANSYMDNKGNTVEYQEANKVFSQEFMRTCVEAIPDSKFNSIEDIKAPMVHNDIFFLHRFNTILAQMITPVVPQVIAQGYTNLYDITQVGWGDSAKYFVESNEMFIVNDSAVGIARGGLQTMYNAEYTVQAHKKEVACYVDWYHVASQI